MRVWCPLAALCALSLPVSAQKNILLIVADDVGLGDIGIYGVGADPPSTPNIDGLAAQGVRFVNAWSYPLCSPTRAAIQTGRYGFRTGRAAPPAPPARQSAGGVSPRISNKKRDGIDAAR